MDLQRLWHLIGRLGVGIKTQRVYMTAEVFCLCEIYHSVIADDIIPYIRYRSTKQYYSDK